MKDEENTMTAAPPNPTRVALYARVSTTGHGQDVGLQLDELRATARDRSWHVIEEFIDDGVSGSAESRPALDRLLKAVKAKKFDLLVIWKLDRLGRSLRHLLGLLDELGKAGTGFISLRDPGMDTTSPQGRLMFQLLGAFAEYERCLIQERVRAGVARARSQGKRCGRHRREIDLNLAHVLMEQGHSIRRVSRMLQVPKSTLVRHLAEARR